MVFDDTESYDDESLFDLPEDGVEGLSEAQREARMEAFAERVQKARRVALSKNAPLEKRLKAIDWLGESGESDVIPDLAKLYKTTDNAQIRKHAAYALGMFKALDEHLNGTPEQQDEAIQRITDIVMENKMGRRRSISNRTLLLVQVVLLVTFAGLMGGALAIGSQPDPTPVADSGGDSGELPTLISTPTPPPPTNTPALRPEQAVFASLQTLEREFTADSNAAREAFLSISRGESVVYCEVAESFNDPAAYVGHRELDADTFPALVEAGAHLVEAYPINAGIVDAFQQGCDSGQAMIDSDVTFFREKLVEMDGMLEQARAQLMSVDVGPTPTPVPLDVTLPPPTREVPTLRPTVTPTLDPSPIRQAIAELQQRIDDMNAFDGIHTQLVTYWEDVQDAGNTAGCLEGQPELPEDYQLPPDVEDIAPQTLRDAVESYNLGLTLSRQSWEVFSAACNNDNLAEAVTTEQLRAETAQNAFAEAQRQLNEVMGLPG